ncbi:MAG: ABC transporter ATP-binding protein [Eubacteriales bacterium]|nr:ABC transporter ATP-binding protein [Eubacteriales bacterium]
MQPLLECKNVCYSYHTPSGETPALSDISFQARDGEFVVIVGPSGCGKSTLLSLICNLTRPESGEILVNGRSVDQHEEFHIGYMPQRDQLFEWRNIYGNITLGLEIQRCMTEENLKFAEKMMREYGLWEFRHVKPSQLSGGMRQRAALIRTLVLRPSLLLLDEPFSALDYQTRLFVADDIYHIIKKEHKTAVLVTHDLGEAVSMADKIIVLSNRPAGVVATVEVYMEMENRTPMKSRNAPEFKEYFNRIWKELNTYAQEG